MPVVVEQDGGKRLDRSQASFEWVNSVQVTERDHPERRGQALLIGNEVKQTQPIGNRQREPAVVAGFEDLSMELRRFANPGDNGRPGGRLAIGYADQALNPARSRACGLRRRTCRLLDFPSLRIIHPNTDRAGARATASVTTAMAKSWMNDGGETVRAMLTSSKCSIRALTVPQSKNRTYPGAKTVANGNNRPGFRAARAIAVHKLADRHPGRPRPRHKAARDLDQSSP